ncbi:hypothetical protein JR316_0010687 [Psilocybe cubensis]|uniref:Uncharacterized protein n=2 Tax=Psilocybe cubensis TaxID=181762 RepID=A0A8H8CK18_PSICU|nr:hypothetical protein JR316_0010687 [Psilocybe cubensis]KAH9476772.1 hypothetical protein JR316_0010687 [Psilocybe cubensis]
MCFNRFDTPCMCTPSQAHDQQMNPYTETFQTRYREQRGEEYNGLNSQSQWHSSAPLPTREEYGHNPSAPGQRRRDGYDRWVKERIAIEALLEMADQPFPAELSKSIHPNLLQGKNISNGTLRHIETNEVSRHPTTSPQNTLFQSTHSVELADITSSEDESFEVTEPVAETVQNKSATTTLTSSEWLSLAFKVQTIHSPTTWHVDGMRVKNSRRKLVPSVDGVASGAASQHQLHKPVEVTIHDLPLIPCVIGKCTENVPPTRQIRRWQGVFGEGVQKCDEGRRNAPPHY